MRSVKYWKKYGQAKHRKGKLVVPKTRYGVVNTWKSVTEMIFLLWFGSLEYTT